MNWIRFSKFLIGLALAEILTFLTSKPLFTWHGILIYKKSIKNTSISPATPQSLAAGTSNKKNKNSFLLWQYNSKEELLFFPRCLTPMAGIVLIPLLPHIKGTFSEEEGNVCIRIRLSVIGTFMTCVLLPMALTGKIADSIVVSLISLPVMLLQIWHLFRQLNEIRLVVKQFQKKAHEESFHKSVTDH